MVVPASERLPNSRPTTTVTTASTSSPSSSTGNVSGTLRLRAVPAETRHIQWAEDVVDNEGMGKKSSKVCCIYHKPREVGESSDEDSSDSSSSDGSDSEPDTSRAQPRGQGLGRPRKRHSHDDDESCEGHHSTARSPGPGDQPHKQDKSKRPSPNAYEKMPKNVANKSDKS